MPSAQRSASNVVSEKVCFQSRNGSRDYWNDENIGVNSIAFGEYSTAKGDGSFAATGATALGPASVALGGSQTDENSNYGVAFGGVKQVPLFQ